MCVPFRVRVAASRCDRLLLCFSMAIFGVALVIVMRYRPEGLIPSRRLAAELHDGGAGS